MRTAISVISMSVMLSACVSQLDPAVSLPSDLTAQDSAVVISRGAGFVSGGSNELRRVSGDLTFASIDRGTSVDLISPIGHGLDSPATFKIQVVPAGQYALSGLKVGAAETQFNLGPWSQPGFTLRPGDVIYLGDIILRSVGGVTEAQVSDMRAYAKAALGASRPDLAARMWSDLVDCQVCVHR